MTKPDLDAIEARWEMRHAGTDQGNRARSLVLNEDVPALLSLVREQDGEIARLREALEYIAEEHDAGRHDGRPEACPANNAVQMWSAAREALSLTPSPAPCVSVIEEIAAERRRQIEAEGWTPEHDDEHRNGELATAAGLYAQHAGVPVPLRQVELAEPPVGWPWSNDWWKPRSPRRDLIRAGALIVAEIERLDRATPSTGEEGR